MNGFEPASFALKYDESGILRMGAFFKERGLDLVRGHFDQYTEGDMT